jgi:hypothetical protein
MPDNGGYQEHRPPTRILTYGEDIEPGAVSALAPIGVSGSRDFRAPDLVARWVQLVNQGALLVGDAGGVDTIVASVAEHMGGFTVVVVPFRKSYGKIGGLARNPDVARHAREFVCFWSGEPNPVEGHTVVGIGSTGTSHAALWALVFGKPLTIYLPDQSYISLPAPMRGKGLVIPKGAPSHPMTGQPSSGSGATVNVK